MDHGRFGPQGAFGGHDGGLNKVSVVRNGETYIPAHLSKDQDISITAGDSIRVSTPGGGGYGEPLERDPDMVLRDVGLGYYSVEEAADLFGVVLIDHEVDELATRSLRAN